MSRSVHETETRVCVHPRVVSPNLVARRARACPMCCTPRKRNESETGAAERDPREVRRLHRGVSRAAISVLGAREREGRSVARCVREPDTSRSRGPAPRRVRARRSARSGRHRGSDGDVTRPAVLKV